MENFIFRRKASILGNAQPAAARCITSIDVGDFLRWRCGYYISIKIFIWTLFTNIQKIRQIPKNEVKFF